VYPDIKIYLWTGYLYEDLLNNLTTHLRHILSNIDYLIDGPYIEEQRDLTLWMRGSRNQKIYDLKHQEKKE
jgi:anaerobic ribonucleoside-triphosphate reductase activating protein